MNEFNTQNWSARTCPTRKCAWNLRIWAYRFNQFESTISYRDQVLVLPFFYHRNLSSSEIVVVEEIIFRVLGQSPLFWKVALVPPRLGKPPTTISQIFPTSTVTVAISPILQFSVHQINTPTWRNNLSSRAPSRATAAGSPLSQLLLRTQTCSCLVPATSPSSSGTWPGMRPHTDTQRDLSTDTPTLFLTVYVKTHSKIGGSGKLSAICKLQLNAETLISRWSLPMVLTLFPHPGTRLSASGSLPLVPPPADLLDTTTTFSPFPSLPITDKLSPDPATVQSSCGTLSVTASSPSLRRDTPIGFHALDSALTHKTQSLSPLDGTSSSR